MIISKDLPKNFEGYLRISKINLGVINNQTITAVFAKDFKRLRKFFLKKKEKKVIDSLSRQIKIKMLKIKS